MELKGNIKDINNKDYFRILPQGILVKKGDDFHNINATVEDGTEIYMVGELRFEEKTNQGVFFPVKIFKNLKNK